MILTSVNWRHSGLPYVIAYVRFSFLACVAPVALVKKMKYPSRVALLSAEHGRLYCHTVSNDHIAHGFADFDDGSGGFMSKDERLPDHARTNTAVIVIVKLREIVSDSV